MFSWFKRRPAPPAQGALSVTHVLLAQEQRRSSAFQQRNTYLEARVGALEEQCAGYRGTISRLQLAAAQPIPVETEVEAVADKMAAEMTNRDEAAKDRMRALDAEVCGQMATVRVLESLLVPEQLEHYKVLKGAIGIDGKTGFVTVKDPDAAKGLAPNPLIQAFSGHIVDIRRQRPRI